MFRQEAPLSKFPYGFSADELAVEVRGVDARSAWRLHEASHIYAVKTAAVTWRCSEAVRPFIPLAPDIGTVAADLMFGIVR